MNSSPSDSPFRTALRRKSLPRLLIAVFAITTPCASVYWLTRRTELPIIMISHPVVSPSGERVAFTVTRGDERTLDRWSTGANGRFNRWFESIFPQSADKLDVRLAVLSLADGHATDTRAEVSGSIAPMTWALDESRIAFVNSQIDPAALNRFLGLDSIDLGTHTVTHLAAPEICSPKFSPNGTWLGYVRSGDLIVENRQSGAQRLIQSGVNQWHWCWAPDSSDVCYIKRGKTICTFDLRSDSERVLFTALPTRDEYPSSVIFSPDGSELGFHMNGWFHSVELSSGDITQRFPCQDYFLEFDWNATGICYLNAISGERGSDTSVMVFDPDTDKTSVVVTGPFSFVRWIGTSHVLVRKGNTELWSFDINDGSGRKLFDEFSRIDSDAAP